MLKQINQIKAMPVPQTQVKINLPNNPEIKPNAEDNSQDQPGQPTGTDSSPQTKDKPEKDQEVEFDGKKYKWLGAQWAEVNAETGKAGKMAEKGIVKTLNDLAGVGKPQEKPAADKGGPTKDFDATHGVPLTPQGAEKFSKLPPEENKAKTAAARKAGYTVDPETGVWSPPEDTGGGEQPAASGTGSTGSQPPAGTIGLAQQPGTSGGAAAQAGGAATGGSGQAGGAAGTSGGGQSTGAAKQPAASGKIDIFSLGKLIKQQKPEVIEAVKKILSSRESQNSD
jgi:hypothetical protein